MKPHYRVRKVKTSSGSTAIQVGKYKGKRFELAAHIGSSKDKEKITELTGIAWEYVKSHTPQLEFDFNPQSEEVLFKKGLRITGGTLERAYSYLEHIYNDIGFFRLKSKILKDFAIVRVLEPASKIKSISLLKRYFNLVYSKTTVFRELEKLAALKDKVSDIAIGYAKDNLNFDFTLVFYDVTTLYFETHREDNFRKNGFSKDNKINQPQILIGLLVEKTGFPVYWDIFKGNTFEGKTIIPVVKGIVKKYKIKNFTIVADAGMLSVGNLIEIEKHKLKYIVGARVGKLNFQDVQKVSDKLDKKDGKSVKIGGTIYEYSSKRAQKNKSDNDKELRKAAYLFDNPSLIFKRSKFIKISEGKLSLNEELVAKHRLLEGIKGYKTNIFNLPSEIIISRYKDLWRIEKSFRIAKTDLEARPIYHRKEISIKYHILIVFVALCMARVIEIQTQKSLENIVDRLRNNWTVTLEDEISGNSLKLQMET